VAQVGETLAVGVEDVEDPGEHRGHHHGMGDALGASHLHPLGRLELALEDEAPTSEDVGADARNRGDVVGRGC